MAAINPLYSVAGLLVGLLVGLTGVGGGSLMTPLLVLLFNFHPSTAVGTDLLYASLTKSVGTVVHGARATVDWAIVRRLATGSVPASLLTLLGLYWIGKPAPEVEIAMKSLLGMTLILTAIAILFQARIVSFVAKRWKRERGSNPVIATIALGAILGALVSMTSVGAGAIGVTVLLILYPDLTTGRIVGSDIAHAVPLTLVAGLGHWAQGNVDPWLLVSLLIGSIPGIIIGSLVGSRASDRILRPALAITLTAVGFTLVH
ncbi:MAG TPA: sulfite exporter TauE/SafE family protein [Sphingobium sp.]